jgi:hypothetical protein
MALPYNHNLHENAGGRRCKVEKSQIRRGMVAILGAELPCKACRARQVHELAIELAMVAFPLLRRSEHEIVGATMELTAKRSRQSSLWSQCGQTGNDRDKRVNQLMALIDRPIPPSPIGRA